MENRNAFLKSLRYHFSAFQAVGKKLAARLTASQFDHYSIPAIIDDDDIQRLEKKIDRIRAALMSAEEYEILDAYERHRMCELKDLLCRAEDVLEEIEFESVQATRLEEFHAELAATDTQKPKREEVSLSFYYSSRESISAKIDRIMETFAEIASDRAALRLDKDDGLRRMGISRVTSTYSLPTGKLHGREEELLRLRQLLLIGQDNLSRPYSLISLVGMPGIGKTTIVQHLCDDKVVQGLFKHVFWVCTSQGFDSKEITITMLNQSGESSAKNDLCYLHCKDLLLHVMGNRLLLVIDDVWIGNRKDELPHLKSHWEILHAILRQAGRGSKVILTTQNNEIAKIMGSDHTVYISALSDDHCWEICRGEGLMQI